MKDYLNDTYIGFQFDLTVFCAVIFGFCVLIVITIFISSALIRKKINKRRYADARKIAMFYRNFLGGLKRDKVSLTIGLLWLWEGDREKADKNLSKIRDVRLDAAKKFWFVMEAYIYDDPALDAKISEFGFANKSNEKGILGFDHYRTRFDLVRRYRETKDGSDLKELEAVLKTDDPLQADLIRKAVDGDFGS